MSNVPIIAVVVVIVIAALLLLFCGIKTFTDRVRKLRESQPDNDSHSDYIIPVDNSRPATILPQEFHPSCPPLHPPTYSEACLPSLSARTPPTYSCLPKHSYTSRNG